MNSDTTSRITQRGQIRVHPRGYIVVHRVHSSKTRAYTRVSRANQETVGCQIQHGAEKEMCGWTSLTVRDGADVQPRGVWSEQCIKYAARQCEEVARRPLNMLSEQQAQYHGNLDAELQQKKYRHWQRAG